MNSKPLNKLPIYIRLLSIISLLCTNFSCTLTGEENIQQFLPDGNFLPKKDAGKDVNDDPFDADFNPPVDSGDRVPFLDATHNVEEDGGCAESSYEPKKATRIDVKEVEIPVAIYIMLDVSRSMTEGDKWADATSSLIAFVNDPESEGLSVALQVFPITEGNIRAGDSSSWFDPEYCANCDEMKTPAVEMGELPSNAQSIADVLTASSPNGIGTPIECALRGLTSLCSSYGQDHPDEKCVGVLITDGEPMGCSSDNELLSSIAREEGVKLYAVGMEGADFALLEKIAHESGTNCTPDDPTTVSCDVSQPEVTLQDAMDAIRETERIEELVEEVTPMECEWVLPEPKKDEIFDKNRVNVDIIESGKAPLRVLKMENGQADCQNYTDGWYYDNEENPIPGENRIIVCESTCERIKNIEDGQISIVLGCKSEVP